MQYCFFHALFRKQKYIETETLACYSERAVVTLDNTLEKIVQRSPVRMTFTCHVGVESLSSIAEVLDQDKFYPWE